MNHTPESEQETINQLIDALTTIENTTMQRLMSGINHDMDVMVIGRVNDIARAAIDKAQSLDKPMTCFVCGAPISAGMYCDCQEYGANHD